MLYDSGLAIRGNSVVEELGTKVMQFTSVIDKCGMEIFEGDILKVGIGEDASIGIVGCNETTGNFYWTGEYADWNWSEIAYDHCDAIEVIGNIYENCDLLNKEVEQS